METLYSEKASAKKGDKMDFKEKINYESDAA